LIAFGFWAGLYSDGYLKNQRDGPSQFSPERVLGDVEKTMADKAKKEKIILALAKIVLKEAENCPNVMKDFLESATDIAIKEFPGVAIKQELSGRPRRLNQDLMAQAKPLTPDSSFVKKDENVQKTSHDEPSEPKLVSINLHEYYGQRIGVLEKRLQETQKSLEAYVNAWNAQQVEINRLRQIVYPPTQIITSEDSYGGWHAAKD
jgi:hypothetical protein